MPQYVEEEDFEEPQQIQRPTPLIPAPIPNNPDDDFFRFRIDASDILMEVKHLLKGEVLIGNEWVKQDEAWMNNKGINKVTHIMFVCGMNKGTFLGNLKKDEIMYKCKMLKKKLARLLFEKYKDYEVPKEMRDLLIKTVVDTVHSGLSRSEGGRESEQLSTAAQRIETHSYAEQQQPERGFKSRIPLAGFFGKR